jgi:hypothetical protein
MTGRTPRRLRLQADPGRLAGFDGETVLEDARTRLGQLRDDVELTHIEWLSSDSIGVVLLTEPTVRGEDIAEIVTHLREILEIGPGPGEWLPADVGKVRGIGGEGPTCPDCWAPDGSHVPGCPREPH